MNAPLSLFLTRFPISPPATVKVESLAAESMLVLSQSEFDARVEAAVDSVRREAHGRYEVERTACDAAHAEALAQAVAAARAEWVASQSEPLGLKLAAGLDAFQAVLADRLEAVLRPFLAEALLVRAIKELRDALDHLLSDSEDRPIRVHGPTDMVDTLRAVCPAPGIEWIVADGVDVVIAAGATRIETRLAAALRALDSTES